MIGKKINLHKIRTKVKYVFVASICLLTIPALLFLYNYKKDSANGRLLVWTVSANIFQDYPLFGTGTGGFQANYMNYQADYFRANPEFKYKMLVDENCYAFNEPIRCGVEYGIVGLFMMGAMLYAVFFLQQSCKNKHQRK